MDMEAYKNAYPDIVLTLAEKQKYINMMLLRINESAQVRTRQLNELQYAQAMYEARERKHFDTVEAPKYWEKVKSTGNDIPSFTAWQLALRLLRIFKTKTGKQFRFTDTNRQIFWALCLYFTGDKRFEELSYTNPKGQQLSRNYSLEKGIMIVGPIGCGKTTLMKMFMANQQCCYSMQSCLKVSESYISEDGGDKRDILEYYSRDIKTPSNSNIFRHTELGICFDDLGIEDVRKKFGNTTNVMAYILTRRYDVVKRNHTHITTNLSADNIETFYGSRLRSRMREMFNQIRYNEKSPDLR